MNLMEIRLGSRVKLCGRWLKVTDFVFKRDFTAKWEDAMNYWDLYIVGEHEDGTTTGGMYYQIEEVADPVLAQSAASPQFASGHA